MGRKRHTPEQIITKLREAEVLLGKGLRVPEVCEELGIHVRIRAISAREGGFRGWA